MVRKSIKWYLFAALLLLMILLVTGGVAIATINPGHHEVLLSVLSGGLLVQAVLVGVMAAFVAIRG